MNKKPIAQACDAAIRLSPAAMKRAAQRAREVAATTGTLLVVSRNGVLEYLSPDVAATDTQSAQEPTPDAGNRADLPG